VVPGRGADLLSGTAVCSALSLFPFGAAVIREEP
jgi:hypothetical protein